MAGFTGWCLVKVDVDDDDGDGVMVVWSGR